MSSDYIDIDFDTIKREPTRKGFGIGLKNVAEKNPKVVGLCADLTESTQMIHFKNAYPERFFEIGIAEQNLVTVASGLASMGYKPFVSSYAAFSPGRNWEQIRTTICLNNRPVTIIGAHAGLSVGLDGATHQMLEDIAIMRTLPNMTVIVPADATEAEQATECLAFYLQPAYLRLAREATAVIFSNHHKFEIGKGYKIVEGHHISIFSTGIVLEIVIKAAQLAKKKNISVEVIHLPTVKPLDNEIVLESIAKTKKAITVEEGQIAAGFGSSICELVAENNPYPILRMGINDSFGESGTPEQLMKKHHLTPEDILKKIIELCSSRT